MSSKMLAAFFTTCIVLQSTYAASLNMPVLNTFDLAVNERIASRIANEAAEYTTTSCGGLLTRAPGMITQHFELVGGPEKAECTWTIQASADHSVYIRTLNVNYFSMPGALMSDPESTDSIDLQIYEGDGASSANRLFEFERESSLDRCISRDRTLTVVLQYAKSPLFRYHDVILQYGFAKRSQISDLLN